MTVLPGSDYLPVYDTDDTISYYEGHEFVSDDGLIALRPTWDPDGGAYKFRGKIEIDGDEHLTIQQLTELKRFIQTFIWESEDFEYMQEKSSRKLQHAGRVAHG